MNPEGNVEMNDNKNESGPIEERRCPSCGAPLAEDVTFCTECGKSSTGHDDDTTNKTLAIVALVCGIASVVMGLLFGVLIPIIGFPLSIILGAVAIIMGAITLNKGKGRDWDGKAMAKGGLITGIIGPAVCFLLCFAWGLFYFIFLFIYGLLGAFASATY